MMVSDLFLGVLVSENTPDLVMIATDLPGYLAFNMDGNLGEHSMVSLSQALKHERSSKKPGELFWSTFCCENHKFTEILFCKLSDLRAPKIAIANGRVFCCKRPRRQPNCSGLDQLKGVFVKGCFCDFDFFLASRALYRFF